MNGSIDWNAVMAIFTAISVVISVISGVYTWISSRDKVTAEKFTQLREKIEEERRDVDRRIHKLEIAATELKGRVDALPTEHRIDGLSRAVSKVEIGLASLTAEVHAQGETVKGVRNAAESINNYLREKS